MRLSLLVFLIIIPQLAWASSGYLGLYFILYFALFIPPSVIALIIWGLNKSSGITKRIKWFMALPFFLILTPAPMGTENILWPSAAVLYAGDLKEKGLAIVFILIFISIVWGFIKSSDHTDEMEWEKQVACDNEIKKAKEAEQLKSIREKTNGLY
jgi:hypothetical protein